MFHSIAILLPVSGAKIINWLSLTVKPVSGSVFVPEGPINDSNIFGGA